MKFLNFFLLLAIVGFNSCNKADDEGNDRDIVVPRAGENFNFYESGEMYNTALKSRSLTYSDAFEIEKVERTGNSLDITLSYGGPCETNKFDVIWDGILLESWPMQTRLVIKRTSSNCSSAEEIQKVTLSIDLVEFIGDQVLVEGTVFYVSNGSKTPDEKNADEVVVHNTDN